MITKKGISLPQMELAQALKKIIGKNILRKHLSNKKVFLNVSRLDWSSKTLKNV
jgi:hypothetical protein